MKDMSQMPGRIALHGDMGDAHNGFAIVKINGMAVKIMFSNGGGWDHVSVSTSVRCPTWPEMCIVKDRFFEPDDVVVQFHPRASEYRNCHIYCLHLWRCQYQEFPTPDPIMVAPEAA